MEVGKLNEAISRLNFYENPSIAFTLEQKYVKDNKIKEIEKEHRVLIEEKGKIEVELKITGERYQDLKSKHDELKNEIAYSRTRDNDTISGLENKLSLLQESYEVLKAEMRASRSLNDKRNYEMLLLKNERDNFEEKYHKNKDAKEDLLKTVSALNSQITELAYEKEFAFIEKKRQDDEKRAKLDLKTQCINQMKSNITNFKSELLRSRSKNK